MNDDKLLLYYYDDGLGEGERRQIEAALAADAELAARYAALCADLDGITDDAQVPAHVVQRMHDTIDRVARPVLVSAGKKRLSFNPLSFAWGAAVTAALAIGIGIGVQLSPEPVPAVTGSPDVFTRSMQVYLQDTRAGLDAIPAGDAESRVRLVLDIVAQNRLYQRAAVQNDSQNLARVLRAFEPILLQLAADDIAPEDAEALRAQLAFELDVMLTKLSRGSSNETQTT